MPNSLEIELDDLAMLAAVELGDQGALASLYDRHSTWVYSVALRVCCDPVLAEEVLQSVFLRVWLSPQQFFSQPGTLEGSLGILSRDLAVDLIRKPPPIPSSPAVQSTAITAPGRRFDPIPHTEVARLMQKKPHALVLLVPDVDRRVLEMGFFEGKTPVEIGAETGVPVDTVGSRVSGALAVLRAGPADPADASQDTGLEVLDLDTHTEFADRSLHPRDVAKQMEGLRRLTHSFVDSPDTILQELVDAAVDLCGADSAGISLETEEKSDAKYYHWVATAGQYNGFLHAVLPRYPSACGICLERGKPQLFRVRQRFFDIMGIEAPLVTDGILLPWQVGDTRGTIFIMAHGRTAAFDKDDGQMMRVLADFAAMAVRHQRQQRLLLQQAKAAASAEMANLLAHRINNPLQGLMQVAYLAAEGQDEVSAKTLGRELSVDLRRLSEVVNESLGTSSNSRSRI